jgi:hypothetical protein
LALAFAAISCIVVAAIPWQWLSPGLIQFAIRIHPTSFFAVAMVFGIALVSYLFALWWLEPRYKAGYVVVLLILALPGITGSIGLQRAAEVESDSWSAPRALIWNNHSPTATEYVILDQEGDRLFLLKGYPHHDPETNTTPTAYHVTTLLMSQVDRIEYLPAGSVTTLDRLDNARFLNQSSGANES